MKSKENKVEVQKGPISLKEQETYKFMGRPAQVMNDIVEAEGRRRGQTMEFHTPKR